ncbi:MAG: circularly permuted type 2 ATP-grasp protein [Alphaproteobacteria bacterium]|nr:circularly permuted type 2 ATP-grasp protein [Alphaproteobacteria bacterium]MBL6939357.1 circularly permuted type 2 ATP-grasp protein [Alphaproteobacteria bacterium]MBL7097162.1 circularly permuted type 2 ATP-grasp protein [Alphaproteobacteria bacterium]
MAARHHALHRQQADWTRIEAGIIQRAKLADTILNDIYGPQKLIAGGFLPPHLVNGHPQFLRPLAGVTPPGGVHVHLYSADLARMPDGSWMIISSRADAPSGIGYALENRIVVGQTFPDLFSDMRVRRLASFFSLYREHVQSLAPVRKGRVVLLTPGPYNEAYFEHAYLSHYLGLTLVQGDDLAVRDGQVYLKTLLGLERVGVIFRRVDSDFCDPLEFRGESALGVPGLADVARAGGVVLANALGGGVMESPAMDAYLPGLSRALLGEELRIPDIPTVWCGTEWGRKEAMARLDRVVVRDAFDARPLFSRGSSARMGGELSLADIRVLKDRITRRGATVVTQDAVPLGFAPVYHGGRFVTRPVSLRVFAAWTPDGYVVMPGGMVRVAQDDHVRTLSIQSGAASKDVWVGGEGPADAFSLLKPVGRALDIRRTGEAPPSRAMDNLFWLGRYTERAEGLVRVLRAVTSRLGDDPAAAADGAERFLLPFAHASAAAIREAAAGDDARLREELRSMLYDRKSPDGLHRVLGRIRQTAWSARDRLSLDTWRTIHVLTDAAAAPGAAGLDIAQALTMLDAVVRRAAAFSGLCAENMTRGPNWLFVDLGRRIERTSHQICLVNQAAAATDGDASYVRMMLDIADSAMTYRSRYLNQFDLGALIDLLLLDETNPRAVAFQLASLERNLRELPLITPEQRSGSALRIVGDARLSLIGANALVLAEADVDGKGVALARLTDKIEAAMTDLSNAITDAYFQHAVRRRVGAMPAREAS